jgi:Na+/H+-dicarboxylate symporter
MTTPVVDNTISPRVASFVLPLAAATGRDGIAIYQAVTVLFVAQVYGVASASVLSSLGS